MVPRDPYAVFHVVSGVHEGDFADLQTVQDLGAQARLLGDDHGADGRAPVRTADAGTETRISPRSSPWA
jgi:hypothetical protein